MTSVKRGKIHLNLYQRILRILGVLLFLVVLGVVFFDLAKGASLWLWGFYGVFVLLYCGAQAFLWVREAISGHEILEDMRPLTVLSLITMIAVAVFFIMEAKVVHIRIGETNQTGDQVAGDPRLQNDVSGSNLAGLEYTGPVNPTLKRAHETAEVNGVNYESTVVSQVPKPVEIDKVKKAQERIKVGFIDTEISATKARNRVNRTVFLIQDRLNRLGYAKLKPLKLDGQVGPHTSEVIAAYQRAHNLKIDGQASRALLHHIEGREFNPVQSAVLEKTLQGKEERARKFRVQLGAFRSPENALKLWQRLESRHGDLLGGLEHLIKRVDAADKGVLNYVYVGPLPSLSSAKSLCRSLVERKVDCLVVQF